MQHTTWVAVGTVPCRTRAKMIAQAEYEMFRAMPRDAPIADNAL